MNSQTNQYTQDNYKQAIHPNGPKSLLRNYLFSIFTLMFTPLNLMSAPEKTSQAIFYPKNIISLDPYFSHHLIIMEKSRGRTLLFQRSKNPPYLPVLVKEFAAVSGKNPGDKSKEGDYKTPEGIYTIEKFLSHSDLVQLYGAQEAQIYGSGAFTLNYPNEIDKRNKKGGTNIWLHSTDNENRIDLGRDSRGCVVVANQDLKDIAQYIELQKTPIMVVEQLEYLDEKGFFLKKMKLEKFFQDWLESWKNQNIQDYLSHYHSQNFYDPVRGYYTSFKSYKEQLFRQKQDLRIQAHHISILDFQDYAQIKFIQEYQSPLIHDTGIKTLYLQLNPQENQYKIIGEYWKSSKNILTSQDLALLHADGNFEFEPKNRFPLNPPPNLQSPASHFTPDQNLNHKSFKENVKKNEDFKKTSSRLKKPDQFSVSLKSSDRSFSNSFL